VPVRSTASRSAVAAGAGMAAALSFAPLGWSYLLPVAVATLVLAVPTGEQGRARASALVGLCFGITFMALHIGWIRVVGPDVAVGLVALEAAFYALLGIGIRVVRGLPAWPLWAAAVWVAVDVLRSVVPWGGFPWGTLAFASVDTPWAPTVALLGTAGTSLLVALVGTVLAWTAVVARRRPLPALGALAAVLAGGALLGVLAAHPPWAGEDSDAPTVRVAAVQGDVPGSGLDAFAERRAVLDNHVRETHLLAGRIRAGSTPQPDLVLWPENSTDIDPFGDATVYSDIQGAVDAVDVPVLVGGMIQGERPGDVENQSIVWLPRKGPVDHYAKRHPVPFGEYIPMRDLLAEYIERLDQIPRDMVPGSRAGNLRLAETDLGVVICFEVAYDGLVHDVVAGGAQLLVVPTNNATYMGTGQVEQQFAISRLRALETDRHVAVVATNGISGLVGPDGEVVERLPVKEPGVWEATIALSDTVTPAVRWSQVGRWLVVLVALGAVATGVLRRRGQTTAELSPAEVETGTGDQRPAATAAPTHAPGEWS
jgi:apolipoprotein N-acyltransferase